MKPMRSAANWSTANNVAVARPLLQLRFVGHRKLTLKPVTLAAPTISVRTISAGEK